mmetsp:Transcript_27804/g.26621  ORF Transcript_27804/g.26621 Transcript_27804/m.26621 type:complete len:462 (+) Transcript_27804:101-1486(+)
MVDDKKSSRLRRDIEKAIWSSLDPISAQKAIDSLNPLLKDLGDTNGKQEKHRISNTKDYNQHKLHKKDYHTRQKGNHPIILPSIQSMLIDYRRHSSIQKSSEPSLRSISEPTIPINKMFFDESHSPFPSVGKGEQQNRKQQHPISSRSANEERPLYNANAAVSLLRLERGTRKPPDFSAFWDWKVSNNNDENGNDKKRDVSKAQIEREIAIYMGYSQDSNDHKNVKENRIQRVKRMQLAYSSHSKDEIDNKGLTNQLQQERKLQKNLSSSQKSSGNTPDMKNNSSKEILKHKVDHVTDSDLVAISKYFEYIEDISHPGTPLKKKFNDKLKMPRNINLPSHLPHIQDSAIAHQDIPQASQGDDDEDFIPYPHYSFSPTNLQSPPPYLPPSKRHINSREGLSSPNYNDSYPKKRNQLPKMVHTPTHEEFDGHRNVDTPDINNFYMGGIEGLLDWTKTLDAELI